MSDFSDAVKLLAADPDQGRDSHGNFSCRSDFDDDLILIKPSGLKYSEVVAPCQARVSDVSRCEMFGFKPSVDLEQHLKVYSKFPDIRAICHTHSPYVCGFAAAGRNIACRLTEQCDYFGHDIVNVGHDGEPEFDWNPSVWPRGSKAVLLVNHGGVVIGQTTAEAVKLTLALEQIAKKTFVAMQLNANSPSSDDRVLIDPDVMTRWHDRYRSSYGQR